jgi:hypothetical protein
MRFSRVVASVLVACAPLASFAQTWSAPDDSVPPRVQKHPTREAAEAAWAAAREKIRAKFEPREAPLAGSVKIVIPSKEFTEKMMRLGQPGLYARLSQEQIDFLVDMSNYSTFRQIAAIVKQRNIFESVAVEEIPATGESGHINPAAGEVVIYIYWPGKNTLSWYYKSDKTRLTPLDFDRGAADPVDRTRHLIDSIEALAAGEKQ